MNRINELIAERRGDFTRGQKILSDFLLEHTDKAAFLNSHELAAVSGVSQSTVMRFSSALGYSSFIEMRQALQDELKYRLTALQKFELMDDEPDGAEILDAISVADARNIKMISSNNGVDSFMNVCARLSMASRVFIYGQNVFQTAAIYLSSYLSVLLDNVICINQTGTEPLSAMADIKEGDLFLCVSFSPHTETTMAMAAYAASKEASVVVISESFDNYVAKNAHIALTADFGEYGVNGTLAPVISLCGSIICLLAHNNERAQQKLRRAGLIPDIRTILDEQR